MEASLRQYDVAARFGVTRATITRLLTRYRLYGTVNDLRLSGRPHVTTARQDRHIFTSHLCKERFYDACVREVDRFGGGSVMVWGGISFNSRMQLIIINGNLNRIMLPR